MVFSGDLVVLIMVDGFVFFPDVMGFVGIETGSSKGRRGDANVI